MKNKKQAFANGANDSQRGVDIAIVAKVPAPLPTAPATIEIIQPASNPAQQQAAHLSQSP